MSDPPREAAMTSLGRALRRIAKKARMSSLDVPILEDAADHIDSLQHRLDEQAAELKGSGERLDAAVNEVYEDVLRSCLRAWPDGNPPAYLSSPLELVSAIIDERDDARSRIQDLSRQLDEQAAELAKGERVFQAVVYAFEGKDVPVDLADHGFVRRAVRHRQQLEQQLAEREQPYDTFNAKAWMQRALTAEEKVQQLEADLRKEQITNRALQHAADRWVPCPDHRDKTGGECPACYGERTERARQRDDIKQLEAENATLRERERKAFVAGWDAQRKPVGSTNPLIDAWEAYQHQQQETHTNEQG